MLPFDNRPWARSVARAVIVLSVLFAIAGAYYFYSLGALHISEVTIILLLLLTIIPPNVAIIKRKTSVGSDTAKTPLNATLHPR
jgi:hypothetical protein